LIAKHFTAALKAITECCRGSKGSDTTNSSSSSSSSGGRNQTQNQNQNLDLNKNVNGNQKGSDAQRSDPCPALPLEWSPSSHLKAAFEVLVSTCPAKCWEYHQTILGRQ
jgi:hypothetical protein